MLTCLDEYRTALVSTGFWNGFRIESRGELGQEYLQGIVPVKLLQGFGTQISIEDDDHEA